MGWLTNFFLPIKPYYWLIKIGLVIVTCVGLFGTGYYKGSQHQKVLTQTKIVKQIEVQYRDVIAKEQPKEAKQLQTNKDKYDAAILQVPQVILANTACDLGPDAIRLLNSVRGSLPTESR